MKVDLLQKHIGAFGSLLRSAEGGAHLFKYDILDHFRSIWTFDTEDFAAMYDNALKSDITRRWWKRGTYRPKEMMLLLIRAEEQYARQVFRDLFDETKQVENRADRFVFYCDEMLRIYKRTNPDRIENNHYQDSSIISLYLAGMYPERYTLFPGKEVFHTALMALGARDTGAQEDLPRFFKLSKLIYTQLNKDPAIADLMQRRARPEGNLLLAHEFICFCGGAWNELSPV